MISREGSTSLEDDDPPVRQVQHADEYFKSGAWARELAQASLATWSVGDVANFVRASGANDRQRADSDKIARIIEEEGVSGALLEAGGPELLAERMAPVVRRWTSSELKKKAQRIVRALHEECAQRASATTSYWERNPTVAEIYGACELTETLKEALTPQPQSAIRYCHLSRFETLDVDVVDAEVSPLCNEASSERFKVVSVALATSPDVIHHNFIYARDASNNWVLIVSVDFAQHGSALPGHWHMNRAPLGEMLPHWGPRYEIVHGDPRACPLWWLLIPEGTRYRTQPMRHELVGDESLL